MGKNVRSGESKMIQFLKSPIRALRKTRDFYIRAITQCAGRMGGAAAMGGPAASTLPKSFSVSSTNSNYDDDLRELIRAASTRSLGIKIEEEGLRQQQPPARAAVVRSMSLAGIGRIDEEKPCDLFDEAGQVYTDVAAVPRTRSCYYA